MRHSAALGDRELPRSDVHAPVELHGVGVDHLAVELVGKSQRQFGLTGSRRPDDRDDWLRHVVQCGRARRSRLSQRGRYQLRSPSMAMAAGISTPRTTVASIRTAEAIPMPNILNSIRDSVAKIENTETMITAALVTTPALAPMPPVMACLVGRPRDRSS